MSLIKKFNELEIQRNVKMMVYGQAGMGKTTLALSSPKPLLLDFDNGVKRVNNAHLEKVSVVQISTWNDILSLFQDEKDDVAKFDTIVVDTIGKMMDYIIAYRCNGGNPRIQDWGLINNDFKWFVGMISTLGKNVVFVAHRDTRKEGDETVFVPALREKSYNSIVTELDLLGYVEMKNDRGVQKRSITFDPTSKNDGKNTCQLPGVMIIPNILDSKGQPKKENDFIYKEVLTHYNDMISQKEEACKQYSEVMDLIKERIEQITDAQSANEFVENIGEYQSYGSSALMKARDLFKKKVQDLGLKLNKETKLYEE